MPSYNPAWAQNLQLAYTYDPNSHGFSAFTTNPGSVSLEVAVSQSNAQGNGWTSGSFYGFTTDTSQSPYTLRRDFFPNGAGQGGILATSLIVTLRRVNTSETVTATFTPGNTPYAVPVQVTLDSGGTPPASWASSLPAAYTYDPNTHGFSAFTTPASGISLEVAVIQSGSQGSGWTSGTFYALTTADSGSGYALQRNFFPSVAGQDGVLANSTTLTFRRIGTSETATFTFTPVNTPNAIPNVLSSTPPPPAWAQNFDSAYTYNGSSHNFTALATSNISNLQVAVQQNGASGSGWTSEQFYPMTSPSGVSGYTHRRDFNPTSPGQGGIGNASVVMAFRNVDANNTVDAVQTAAFVPTPTSAALRPGPITTLPVAPVGPPIANQTATVGQVYSFTVPAFIDSAFNVPLTYSASSLPPGLSFNNRVISGTPTTAGTYTVQITATNRWFRSITATFTITVNAGPGQPVPPIVSPQTATVNQSYMYTVPVFTDPNGLPLTYVEDPSSLPAGLTFNRSTRVLSGIPTANSTNTIRITATNTQNLSATLTFTLTVSGGTGGGTMVIGYQTNPSLLNLQAQDIQNGSFTLVNTVTLPAGSSWRYFIGSERQGYDAAAFNANLRFPQGVPILVEVWAINPSEEIDYLRNGGQVHAEQLFTIY